MTLWFLVRIQYCATTFKAITAIKINHKALEMQGFFHQICQGIQYNIRIILKARKRADLRVDILTVRGKRCKRCGVTKFLHVHHKTYANLGNEEPEDLEILCKDCHAEEHGTVKKKKAVEDKQNAARKKWRMRQQKRQAKKRKKHSGIEGRFTKVKGVLCYRKKEY
jgi:hypothetical protein